MSKLPENVAHLLSDKFLPLVSQWLFILHLELEIGSVVEAREDKHRSGGWISGQMFIFWVYCKIRNVAE